MSIWLQCSSPACKFLAGPFTHIEDAQPQLKEHDALGKPHQCYYVDLEAAARHHNHPWPLCSYCGETINACDCQVPSLEQDYEPRLPREGE